MLSQYPPVKNMWRGHLTHTPALAIAHGSALAKYDTCRPITATFHATWTNRFDYSMHKDSVHKNQHQVCSYCLGALNGSPLLVGGRKPSSKHKIQKIQRTAFYVLVLRKRTPKFQIKSDALKQEPSKFLRTDHNVPPLYSNDHVIWEPPDTR